MAKALRALRSEDRAVREAVLGPLADGRLRPEGASDAQSAERELRPILHGRGLGGERALAVRALGRLGRPSAFALVVEALARETDDRVLAAAEEAIRAAPAEVAPLAVKEFDAAEDPLARAALLRILAVLPGPEARQRVWVRARSAGDGCTRAAALLALGRDRDPEALEALLEALDDDDPGVRAAAVESLQRLTGEGFGLDPAKWKAWWKARDPAAPLGAAPPAPPPDGKPDARRYAHEADERETFAPEYFGIPVRGRRVAFVFDVSASMRYKLPLACDELVRAVKGLPSRSLFEVVFFNEFVFPWRGRMSHADPVTKELLVRHLPTLEIKSYTNLFDAIEKALELEADEVFVISDGEPNRGRKRLPKQILSELEAINTGHAVIHTISLALVRDGDEHVALLRRIAEDHQGQHVQRTLR
jgi:hypothetical protein